MEAPPFGDPLSSWWPYIIALIVGVVTCIKSYVGGPSCPSESRINGKTIIVTGGNSGIGYQIALELAKRGGSIIIACRDAALGQKAADELKRKSNNQNVEFKELNLTSLKSVREFARNLECEKVDVLVNNAGIMWHPFAKTEDDLESHLAVNYLGHFLLTHLLLPKLKQAPEGRILNVTALAHFASDLRIDDLNRENGYIPREAYGQSKLALLMMARFMVEKLKGTNVTINAVNPGLVRGTRLFRLSPFNASFMTKFSLAPWIWLFMKSPQQGAQTAVYMAVAPELNQTSGKYFSDCEVKEPSDIAKNEGLSKQLYERSCQLVGIEPEI